MSKHLIIFWTILTLANPAYGACEQNVQKIKTGTSSPCDGWIVSEPQMQEFAKSADKLDLQEKLIKQQEHLQKLTDEEVEFYRTQSKRNAEALSQSQSKQFLIGAGAFVLGVVVTGLAAKAALEATR